jgi:hypothetical protein
MQSKSRLAVLSVAGCLALAGAAIAKPPHPSHPNNTKGSNNSQATGRKCAAHKVAYIASGTLVSLSTSPGTGNTFDGMVSFTVARANHHAATTKGTSLTLTLTNSRVRLGRGVTSATAGDDVKVIGKITAVAKRCTNQSAAGVVTVRKITVSMPHAH